MTERSRTVLVDMDGVMANFDKAALAHISASEIVLRTNFYVSHDYPEELRASMRAVLNTPDFFEGLEPMPGLIEAWQAMVNNGWRPRVASAPLSSNPSSVEGKIKWLDRTMVPVFGPSIVEQAIIDKEKWKYEGLALIDDRPDVPRGTNGANTANWEHILFGWPHLDTVPMATAAYRLLCWGDVDNLLLTLETIDRSK